MEITTFFLILASKPFLLVMRLLSTLLLYISVVAQCWATPAPKTHFVRNNGQWDSSIRYRADIPGGYLLVKNTGLQYVFIQFPEHGANKVNARQIEKVINGHSVEMQFIEANLSPKFENNQPIEAKFNYFLGADRSKWQQAVPAFEEIIIKDIYPNIDFRLYGIDQSLKYEYIVKPDADVSKISTKYIGADALSLDNQGFNIKTSINSFKEFQPYSYQKIAGVETEVKSNFRLQQNIVQFDFPQNYDKSQTLTIDPQLVFSSYSGSKSDNWGHTATYDADGNLYAGGTVFGGDFPTTTGAFQVTQSGTNGFTTSNFGITDAIIMKFSPDGSKLLYGTYLGGKESDVPFSLVVNSKGELVILGTTSSKDFPISTTAYQKTFGGGQFWADGTDVAFNNGSDIFVAVLSQNGDKLTGSTYIGGSRNDGYSDTRRIDLRNYGDEFRGEIVVDSLDNIYFTSTTASINFPLKNASQSTKFGGDSTTTYDAVVCQLNPNCSDLLWSTYLGGDGLDIGYGIKVAKTGSIYVSGLSTSTNLSTQAGALNKSLFGKTDGFLAKFTQNKIEQLTYLGTNQDDETNFVEIDKQENVYVYGISTGSYPISEGVYRNEKSGQFIHCLDKNLTKTIFSTVIGSGNGTYDIVPTAFLVNDCGNIYVTGWGGNVDIGYNTKSSTKNLPITDDAIQKSTTGSNYYLAILESGAKSLLFGTYFGASAPTSAQGNEVGDHLDGGTCRFNKNGVIFHAACSCKSRGGTTSVGTFPTTINAYQKTLGSDNCNMAAFKIDMEGLKASFDMLNGSTSVSQVCAPAKINFTSTSIGGKTYEWQLNGQIISRTESPTQIPFNTPGDYVITLKIYNKISCRNVDSTSKILRVTGFTSTVTKDTTICSGNAVQLLAQGGYKYSWSPNTFLDNSNIANPIAKPTSTTKYTVTISKNGCDVPKDVTITINDTKPDFQISEGKEICAGQKTLLQATGNSNNITWSGPNMSDTLAKAILISPLQSSTYTATAIYPDGCKPQKSVTLTIDNSFKPDFDVNISQDCNKPLQLVFLNKTQNATSMAWAMGNGDTLKTNVPENYKYSKGGDYKITLKSYNKLGCELTTSKTITIPENDNKVPNVITPNNDGKNDYFVIGFKNASLAIYNRWGKLIFESKNYQNDWGNGIDAGNYFYVLITSTGTECKGMIEVID